MVFLYLLSEQARQQERRIVLNLFTNVGKFVFPFTSIASLPGHGSGVFRKSSRGGTTSREGAMDFFWGRHFFLLRQPIFPLYFFLTLFFNPERWLLPK